MIETKASAERIAQKLDALISVPKPLRIHWTGCPNSCGQVQVADIGLMGGPAKKLDPESGKMKAVPGVSIFVGGRVGEDAYLSLDPCQAASRTRTARCAHSPSTQWAIRARCATETAAHRACASGTRPACRWPTTI